MDFISVITLLISIGTLACVIAELYINLKQRKIDRRIEVTIGELRRMHQELFKNVLGILEIAREVENQKLLKEENILFNEVLQYRIGVWINLNRKNRFSEELRSKCNELAVWIASFIESTSENNEKLNFLKEANLNRQRICILIDKYIEEEDRLIEVIVNGKKDSMKFN